jgi:hypothetical protein
LFSPIPRADDPQEPSKPQPPPAPLIPQQPSPPPAPPVPAAQAEPEADEPEPDIAGVREGTLPSGKDLFAAHGTVLTDWWNQGASGQLDAPEPEPVAPAPVAAPASSETTPIFDEMLSAWFRTANAPAKPAAGEPASGEPVEEEPEPAAESVTTAADWDFASDENWRTVQAVSQTPPSTFTPAGLPMRRRGEQLMPGSAAPTELPSPSAMPGLGARPNLPARDPADVRGRLNSFQQGINRGRKAKQGADTPEAAEAAPTASPLAPAPADPKPEPVAGEARSQGRLQGQVPLDPEPARPEAITGQPENAPLPRRKAKPVQPPAAPATASAAFTVPTTLTGTSGDLGSAAEWSFDTDADWRTVQAAAKTAPSTFTSAGLPRRRRGEQLLPGSAGAPAAPSGPRPQRDPDDVRGRLSSFQQGIRRGRHRTAQPTEANQETLEGE